MLRTPARRERPGSSKALNKISKTLSALSAYETY
nr:MAG TPA: hypothetical protein [Bacteriophage sp.]